MDVNDEEVARSPTPEMRQALREQWTPALLAELVDYAERRARMVRMSGRTCPAPAAYAEELVHDAHTLTWAGELAWDHRRCSLLVHLRQAIKSRTRHEVEAATRIKVVDVLGVESDAVSSPDVGKAWVFPALVNRICDELEEATRTLPDCIGILRAWRLGLLEREEILELTGLTAKRYHAARGRLLYASRTLGSELRELVRDYLRSST